MKPIRLSLLAALFLASAVLPAAAAVPDPDRDGTAPTHWRQAIWHPEDLEKLRAELHTLPIRMALKTW